MYSQSEERNTLGEEILPEDVPSGVSVKVKRAHRLSLLILLGLAIVMIVATSLFELSQAALIVLYLCLVASAIFVFWTTMIVMINRKTGIQPDSSPADIP